MPEPKLSTTARGGGGGAAAGTQTVAAPAASAPPAPVSGSTGALPAGFFDDSLADAKARNVDIRQLASAQAEQDWEQFQEFVAEVEQQDARDDKQRQEEAKEKDAEQTLENMAYVDRYRVALERAAKLAALKKRSTKRRADECDEGSKDAAETPDSNAIANGDDNSSSRVDGEVDVVNVRTLLKKQRTQRKTKPKDDDREDDEAFDPSNWRSKAL